MKDENYDGIYLNTLSGTARRPEVARVIPHQQNGMGSVQGLNTSKTGNFIAMGVTGTLAYLLLANTKEMKKDLYLQLIGGVLGVNAMFNLYNLVKS